MREPFYGLIHPERNGMLQKAPQQFKPFAPNQSQCPALKFEAKEQKIKRRRLELGQAVGNTSKLQAAATESAQTQC